MAACDGTTRRLVAIVVIVTGLGVVAVFVVVLVLVSAFTVVEGMLWIVVFAATAALFANGSLVGKLNLLIIGAASSTAAVSGTRFVARAARCRVAAMRLAKYSC